MKATDIIKKHKDSSQAHADYEAAMNLRDALHEALVDSDYKAGYVSSDETPGPDYRPVVTQRRCYNGIGENHTRVEITQTFLNNTGKGETCVCFTDGSKSYPADVG